MATIVVRNVAGVAENLGKVIEEETDQGRSTLHRSCQVHHRRIVNIPPELSIRREVDCYVGGTVE